MRDYDQSPNTAGLQVVSRLCQRIVLNDLESFRAGGDAFEHFLNFQRLGRVVEVNHRDANSHYFPAEGIAQHHQLQQRKNHGGHHQRGAAEEFTQVALDQRPDTSEIH